MTNIEIPAEVVKAIFAQSLGQRAITTKASYKDIVAGFLMMVDFDENEISISQPKEAYYLCGFNEAQLLKKPLSAISNLDEAECDRIFHGNSAAILEALLLNGDSYFTGEGSPADARRITDFLRSKGYAMPYGEYSVEDLVAAGIYKLETA